MTRSPISRCSNRLRTPRRERHAPLFEHADHSFHVPAKSGTTDKEVMTALLDSLAAWIASVVGR